MRFSTRHFKDRFSAPHSQIIVLQRTAVCFPLCAFYFSPYCFYCFVNVHKLDFIFRILLKLVLLLGKRDLSKNIYIFKKQFNSRYFSGSADRECIRPHSSALMTRGEKTHGRFPLVAPLFPSKPAKKHAMQNARTQSSQDAKRQNAEKTHATTKTRKAQRQRPQHKTQAATHAKSPHIIQNPAFIPLIPPQLISRRLFLGVIKYQGGRVGMGAKNTPQMGSTC